MPLSVVLFGVDSIFSVEVLEVLNRLEGSIHCGVLTGEPEWDLQGIEYVMTESEITHDMRRLPVVVPWVTPSLRENRLDRATAAGFRRFETLVDPSAVVASTARLSEGVFINAGVIVGAKAVIGPHVVLNRSVSVGHHAILDELTSTGPGATIAGRCRLGRGAMLGAGSSVAPGTKVGERSVVGIGAAVLRDVPDGVVMLGNPARVVKRVDREQISV